MTFHAGDRVVWDGIETVVLLGYDHDFVYIAVGDDGAQLVHVDYLRHAPAESMAAEVAA